MQALLFCLCLLVTSLGLVVYAAEPAVPMRTIIILLGPPGSGKGTQAVRLSKELAIPHISTGDLFRDNISKSTELGKKAKSFIDAGQLVPDSLVLEMLFDRVARPDCTKGFILDGFPRTIPQAEAFDASLKREDKLMVVNLDLDDSVIIKRLTGRLSCKQCGNIQHRDFSPPKVTGKCDNCGGELIQRSDDSEPVVKERLKVYHSQTEPLVAYYTKKQLLTTINGDQSPDAVYASLIQKITAVKS